MGLRHDRWSLAAIASGAAYLVWRALATLDGVPRWLSWPVLAVEVVGWLALVAWLVVLHRPGRAPDGPRPPAAQVIDRVDVFVRVDAQPLPHLLATLAGVRHLRGVESTTVLASLDRPDVLAIAAEHGVAVVGVSSAFDAAGFTAALAVGVAPGMVVLDAGDVPRPDLVAVLGRELADPGVAAVVGRVGDRSPRSAEHDHRGRHERRFEREILLPATSPAALLAGSGTLLRRTAVARVGVPTGSRRGVEMRLAARLRADGFAVVAPAGPVVLRERGATTAPEVRALRRRETAGALELLRSADGPVLTLRLRLADRVALLAPLVRPLAGLRRAAFVLLLGVCLLSGLLPLDATWWQLVLAWLPPALLGRVALRRLTGDRLELGEQARWSFASMGAAVAALGGAGREPIGAELTASPGWRARMVADRALTAVVVGLGLIVPAVVLSERRGGPLPTMGTVDRAVLLAVALWSVGVVLSVLRCLPGARTARRSTRVRVAEVGRVGDFAATICDLTPFGAGAVIEGTDLSEPIVAGQQVRVSFAVPTRAGRRSLVTASALVRTARRTPLGYMCGLEFADLDFASSDALFEYCEVMSPEVRASAERTMDDLDAPRGPRRVLVRTAAIAALLAAVAATAPSLVEAASGAPSASSTTSRDLSAELMPVAAVCVLALVGLAVVLWAMLGPSVRERRSDR